MANKLPWMKHDHNARNDDFLKRACARFGHFGYAGWFRMLETLHEHGIGDKLCMERSRFASELGSKWPPVRNLLDFYRESGKVQYNENGKELVIEVKNFRKKQDKKNLKIDMYDDLKSLKPAQEEEGEGEEDNNIRQVVKSLVKRFVIGWSSGELESHQFPYGKDRGIRIIDLEASRCQWYLDNNKMDAKTTAALRHRVKLKAEECVKGTS